MATEKKPTHRSPLMTLCLLMTLYCAQAYGQVPADIEDQIEVELIVPQSVTAGEGFNVYARVTNRSEGVLEFPSIVRPDSAASNSLVGYSYIPCGIYCLIVGGIEPGETVYLGAGTYYYTDEFLKPGELRIDDYTVQYLDRGDLTVKHLPVVPMVTIMVAGTDEADTLNPAFERPERQPLQVRDFLESGDELLLHDPNTGNDWVRLGASRDLVADGFSLARISQVEELVLNHLHAEGQQAQLYDVYPDIPYRLDDALEAFVQLMQPVFETESSAVLTGAVADRTGFSAGSRRFGILDFFIRLEKSSPQCACNNTFGMRRTSASPRVGESPEGVYSRWLVRSSTPLPTRPLDIPSFFDNELVIPELLVDGVHYQGTLTLIDSSLGLYRLSGLDAVEPSGSNLEFNAATGLVNLPEVVILDGNGETSRVRAVLGFVENTTPPLFQLLTLEQL